GLGRPRDPGTPGHLAGQLIQRDQRGVFAPRRANEEVAVDEHRFADAPLDILGAEFLEDIEPPDYVSLRCSDANQIAIGPQAITRIVIDGRGAARSVAGAVMVGMAGAKGPTLLTGLGINRDEEFIFTPIAHGVDLTVGDGDAGIAQADVRLLP